MRGHRGGHPSSMDETLAMLALNISGGGTLAGDVTGPDHANTVVRIQNQAIGAGTAAGQVPVFSGVTWVPTSITSLIGGTVVTVVGGVTQPGAITDILVKFDSSNGLLPVYQMPTVGLFMGKTIAF